jgi:predicted methyltransferase
MNYCIFTEIRQNYKLYINTRKIFETTHYHMPTIKTLAHPNKWYVEIMAILTKNKGTRLVLLCNAPLNGLFLFF